MKTALFPFIMIAVVLKASDLYAQNDSTDKRLTHRNNIKLNLTTNIFYRPSFVMAYERTIKPHQTLQIEGGYTEFPFSLPNILPSNIIIEENKKKSGFKVAIDYRFYFKKENKYEAPHGLYWGPFLGYYHFRNERTVSVTDTSFATGKLNFISTLDFPQVGVNIGYQFVVAKRISIDMNLFGPSITYYKFKVNLDGDFNANKENEYLQELYEVLLSSLPLLGTLVSDQQVTSDGVADLFFMGFRYSVSAGFRF